MRKSVSERLSQNDAVVMWQNTAQRINTLCQAMPSLWTALTVFLLQTVIILTCCICSNGESRWSSFPACLPPKASSMKRFKLLLPPTPKGFHFFFFKSDLDLNKTNCDSFSTKQLSQGHWLLISLGRRDIWLTGDCYKILRFSWHHNWMYSDFHTQLGYKCYENHSFLSCHINVKCIFEHKVRMLREWQGKMCLATKTTVEIS